MDHVFVLLLSLHLMGYPHFNLHQKTSDVSTNVFSFLKVTLASSIYRHYLPLSFSIHFQ
jgi:hypothetical protein